MLYIYIRIQYLHIHIIYYIYIYTSQYIWCIYVYVWLYDVLMYVYIYIYIYMTNLMIFEKRDTWCMIWIHWRRCELESGWAFFSPWKICPILTHPYSMSPCSFPWNPHSNPCHDRYLSPVWLVILYKSFCIMLNLYVFDM